MSKSKSNITKENQDQVLLERISALQKKNSLPDPKRDFKEEAQEFNNILLDIKKNKTLSEKDRGFFANGLSVYKDAAAKKLYPVLRDKIEALLNKSKQNINTRDVVDELKTFHTINSSFEAKKTLLHKGDRAYLISALGAAKSNIEAAPPNYPPPSFTPPNDLPPPPEQQPKATAAPKKTTAAPMKATAVPKKGNIISRFIKATAYPDTPKADNKRPAPIVTKKSSPINKPSENPIVSKTPSPKKSIFRKFKK